MMRELIEKRLRRQEPTQEERAQFWERHFVLRLGLQSDFCPFLCYGVPMEFQTRCDFLERGEALFAVVFGNQGKTAKIRYSVRCPEATLYFPMQKVEKIKFRMSSGVVWPVSESRAVRAR